MLKLNKYMCHCKSWTIPLSFIILSILLSLSKELLAQTTKSDSSLRKEFYFSFRLRPGDDLELITKQISIDDLRNDTVFAYANTDQLIKFTKLGYSIALCKQPVDSVNLVMNDRVVLGPKTTWDFYPTYTAYEDLMNQFQANYPNLCQIQTIGTLASGRKILIAKISDNVALNETEPEFLYTSSIHGDETTGYILMLHFIDYLLSNYGSNTEVTSLINNLEIFINPLSNPDGTYAGGNSSVSGATRSNANGIDLNRNYPDPQDGQHPDGNAWQPETVAFMNFATQHHFVMSANFHGGAEVLNYPWDTWATLHADDKWFQFICREYADTVHLHAPSGYMDYLNNGITNGYAWYSISGGRQDYMNYYHHCREVTMEISDTKLLPANKLIDHWNYNRRSFINYLKESLYGIHGIITDQTTGNPVVAKVYINGHDNSGSECYSSDLGDYHRLIKGGTYTLEITAPCYQTQVISGVVVTDKNTTILDIQLIPSAGVTTTPPSSITMNSAVSGGNIMCTGGYDITLRGVCWSTSVNPTIENNYTLNGSDSGSFTSIIGGLNPSTLYHIRAYATSSQGTFYGEDISFTTSCGSITNFPWLEGFENSGTIPACWSQEQINNSGINWTFITGNGGSSPPSAHTGTYNACLKDNTSGESKTRLISPELDLRSILNPTLSFWHTQALWSSDQDQLSVYYRTSATNSWVLLSTYTTSITSWTYRSITLPESSETFYIAFEGNAKYGYGICLDDVSITGTPISLTVLPSSQIVSATTLAASYTVTSNGSWTATSDQPWCTVTPSGSGNGTINTTVAENTSADPRVANITISITGISPVTVTLTQEGAPFKTLNIIAFPEGFFNGTALNQTHHIDNYGLPVNHFGGSTVDTLSVFLAQPVSPWSVLLAAHSLNLTTSGNITVPVPTAYASSYYVIIRHRQSIETWSKNPVSFAGSSISYNFTSAAGQAFGNNMKDLLGNGTVWGLFAGDLNHSGYVELDDVNAAYAAGRISASGYLIEDIDGDGFVEIDDVNKIYTNSISSSGITKPQ